ncbi:nickel-responsive transcriptional regulator NikR [Desulfovibrio sp. An276]|uniref:nickel-responsive transcriptional regulator NikR n=1 Tax=Desulfovibrio sp. An276 TaxID=1965618 RepID=UPI000B396460|nr:nickel-responsive transcriptional regulator NikR [Desulfovibrio sp. An276]OUO49669.1 nickel-responsive transcriptional regulator NikR [Desulfovibrio sp. An276]
MESVVRLGVSLPKELLEPFDRLVESKGYQSRSEAIRDLIRKTLVEEEWRGEAREMAGTLTMVYDHHNRDLPMRLMDIQHDHHDLVVTTQHVHLDHHNCLEVLVLRGPAREIARLADRLIACNGVKHGVFVPSTTGRDIA